MLTLREAEFGWTSGFTKTGNRYALLSESGILKILWDCIFYTINIEAIFKAYLTISCQVINSSRHVIMDPLLGLADCACWQLR